MLAVLTVVILGLFAWALWATFRQNEETGQPALMSESPCRTWPTIRRSSTVSAWWSAVRSTMSCRSDEAIDVADTGAAGFVLGDDAELLVVGSNLPALTVIRDNEDIAEGDIVQVTGTVQAFDRAEFENELGARLQERLFQDFDDRPALRATGVNLVPVVPSQGEQRQVTVQGLEDEPNEILGSELTVPEAEVEDVISPRVATVSDDVLVITPPNTSGLTDGAAVEVSGRVVEVSTVELVNALGVENDQELFEELGIDDSDLDGYEVAIVAGSVTPGR